MAKKFQVFISSTYEDLKTQRDEVVKAVLQLGHLPVGMEMFNAGDQTQWETIKSYIDSSDYYLVILAHRYGTKGKGKKGLSYTETEYDYAGKQGIPRLGFVIDKNAAWPASHVEADAKKELDAFKSKVGKARVIKFWDTTDKLAYHVSLSLGNEIAINPRTGWVRATEAVSPQVADELAELSKENRQLKIELSNLQFKSKSDPVEKIIIKNEVSVKGELVAKVKLVEVFLAVCEKQPATVGEIFSVLSGRSSWPDDKKIVYTVATEEALGELKRLGVVNDRLVTPEFIPDEIRRIMSRIHWELTEKGNQLYAKLRYKLTNTNTEDSSLRVDAK